MTPIQRLCAAAIFLVPFVVLGYWLREYSFNVLAWDDWGLFMKRYPGDDLAPSFRGLFNPSSGHRIPLLHLSLIPLFSLWNGDPRLLIPLSVGLSAAAGLLLLAIARRTLAPCRRASRLADTAVIALAVASPLFGHAWLWWICWPIFLPFACLLGGVLLLSGTGNAPARYLLALFFSILAPLAHASGAVVWVALIPVIWARARSYRRPWRLAACLAWAATGLAILWPFIATAGDYQAKRDIGMVDSAMKTASYALVLLGGNLGQAISDNPLPLSRILGGALALAGGGILLLLFRERSDPSLASRLRPWSSVFLFGLLAAAVVAVGRSGLPDEQALAGRYLLLTYPVYLGVFFSLRILIERHAGGLADSSATILASLLLMLQVNAWFEGHRSLKADFARREARVASLNFIRVFPENPALQWCWIRPLELKPAVEKLHSHGKLFGIRLYQTKLLSEIGRPHPLQPVRGGHVTSASTDADGNVMVRGYAWFPDLDKPADLILLSFSRESDGQEETIFCLVPMEVRDDLYRSHERKRRPDRFAAWEIRLAPSQFPPGEIVVRAWAFDHANKRYHALRNPIHLADGRITGFDREVTGREEERLSTIWPEALR